VTGSTKRPKKIEHNDISHFQDYDIHVPTRTLYMGSLYVDENGADSGVDAHMAERVIKGLHILDNTSEKGDQPITIIMNNPGGDYYHGMAIYNAIKACKNHITIICYGHAMSMGGIIFQAADERVMAEDASFMMHYGIDGYVGHAKIFEKWAEQAKKGNLRMEQILIDRIREKKPKFRLDKLRKMLDYDTILNPKETLELGLCDRIL
jgi:ATP-dependent Clp endopeptidase proteolytic subunit ClpP